MSGEIARSRAREARPDRVSGAVARGGRAATSPVRLIAVVALVGWLLVCGAVGWGQAPSARKCTVCHGRPEFKMILPDGRIEHLYVAPDVLASSVHSGHECEDCHSDITEIPHLPGAERVICTRCHFEGSPVGVPQTTAYRDYTESVHGVQLRAGNAKAPMCQDCHGSHDVRAPADSTSRVYKTEVPETCGSCHLVPYAEYSTSVHGVALLQDGNKDAPSCVDCHGEHKILGPATPGSSVYATNIEKTCAHCHAAEGIMGKYGIETAQVDTYEESYHGIAGRFGERTVANCASCHGVHDIRPPEDPQSQVHISNIPKTCGKCHPGANPNFARGKIHVEPESRESGPVYYVATAFKWLTTTVICALVIHIVLDFNRKRRAWKKRS